MQLKKLVGLMMVAGIAAPTVAFATNGMNMEGYGPIATGMGGASMAYDNGAAAMMGNPTTIGLMKDGSNRLDLAVGGLHPDVTSRTAGMPNASSGGDAYYMPAVGWVTKKGPWAYGIGVFAQGGMGTEYSGSDWVSMGTGLPSRSELGVGRAMVPVSYDVNPDLKLGGSVDFVWANLDLQMAMSAAQMGALAAGGNLTASGPGAAALGGFLATPTNVGYFNFSNDNDYTGEASSTGFAFKLGFVYKINPQLTVGGTYHSETNLGDLETNANAELKMITAGGTQTMTGTIKVVDFQWPETYGIGLAYQASDQLMIAADYKRINWSRVMKNFKMSFSTPGLDLTATLPQNWDDQDVFEIGASYKLNEAFTLRAGVNLANNPIPDAYLTPLFPAIVEDHYTFGVGYNINKESDLNFSLVYAPEVSVTAPATAIAPSFTVDHAQTHNWQLMYSYRF